jgi:hypothetical protein
VPCLSASNPFLFDLTFVDPKTDLLFVADVSNRALDVFHASTRTFLFFGLFVDLYAGIVTASRGNGPAAIDGGSCARRCQGASLRSAPAGSGLDAGSAQDLSGDCRRP